MAPDGVVSQLLALVQWRHELRLTTLVHNCHLSVTLAVGAEPDWQWIRVGLADSRADLHDCQWLSPELNAAGLQLLSDQLGLLDCICAGNGRLVISSNFKLKLRPTWNFPTKTWNLTLQRLNKSMCWIKTVSVQLHTRPQHVGDGEAGGGGAPGPWRPQPAPSCRPGAMI